MCTWFRNCWRDHSLSVFYTAVAVASFIASWFCVEGFWYDFWMTNGGGAAILATAGFVSGKLVERNKPEAPPK